MSNVPASPARASDFTANVPRSIVPPLSGAEKPIVGVNDKGAPLVPVPSVDFADVAVQLDPKMP
jgi:hypothetical protein